ncbi:MAG: thymidine kinase [Bacilli bacterium]|nr:thymidine kinase [Bacilli bacterium]
MSKLYFRYGAMNCGKSTALMQVAHNYQENNMKVILIKSSIDTKGNDHLESRIGMRRKVDVLLGREESVEKAVSNYDSIDCILVDEAQFLSTNQIDELWKIAKKKDIPVICYGLRGDFQSHLFEGSKRLLELADEIEELITICSCGKRAKFNARYVNGEFTLNGEEVLIDGSKDNVIYKPLCGKCYLNEIEKFSSIIEDKPKQKIIKKHDE